MKQIGSILKLFCFWCIVQEISTVRQYDHHRVKRSGEGEEGEDKTCDFAKDILGCFSDEVTQNSTRLQHQCPKLAEKLKDEKCKENHGDSNDDGPTAKWKPWVATMVSILFVSAGSLVGFITIPLMGKKWFPYLLDMLVALAVSVLVGDATLHLFPHSLGLHAHGDEALQKDSFLWKCVLFLTGIFAFFLFEISMHAFGSTHSHTYPVNDDPKSSMELQSPESLNKVVKKIEANKSGISMKEFKSVAWMILVGDALHNFMDGVAIGAAYSEDWPSGFHGGISTSIAMVLHEVPHELGDFAVLINSDLSIKQALLMNFISSLTAFLGGILGVILGTEWNAVPYIFAITAGFFVYIAMTDMLPEVLKSPLIKVRPFLSIGLQSFGLLLGMVIMFCIAAWESKLKKIVS